MSGVSSGGIGWGRRLGQVRADPGPRALAALADPGPRARAALAAAAACLPAVLAGTGGPGGWRY